VALLPLRRSRPACDVVPVTITTWIGTDTPGDFLGRDVVQRPEEAAVVASFVAPARAGGTEHRRRHRPVLLDGPGRVPCRGRLRD